VKKILLFLLLLNWNCSQNQENSEIVYFDLKGLITKQIQVLNQNQPHLKKLWQIGSKKETKEFEKTDWSRELEVFVEADINKSGLKNSYEILKNKDTEKFTLKKGESAPIKYILITKDQKGNPVRIELESSMNNYLFDSKSMLVLKFEGENLKYYSAEGYQKLFFGKADSTKIEGIIL
jgi:hypothetical protein